MPTSATFCEGKSWIKLLRSDRGIDLTAATTAFHFLMQIFLPLPNADMYALTSLRQNLVLQKERRQMEIYNGPVNSNNNNSI